MAVAAIALVDVDAAGLHAGKPLQIGDDGPQGMAVIWVAVKCLGMEDELSALG